MLPFGVENVLFLSVRNS